MSKALGLIEVNGYLAAVEAADSALKAAGVTLVGLEKVNAAITVVKLTGDVGAVKAAVDAGTAAAEGLGRLRTSHVIPRLDEQLSGFLASQEKKAEAKAEIKVEEVVTQNKDIEIKNQSTDEKYITSLEQELRELQEEIKEIKEEVKATEEKEKSLEADFEKKAKEEAVEDFIDELIEAKNKATIKEKVLEPVGAISEGKANISAKVKATITEVPKTDLNSMKVEELRRLARNLKLPMTNKQIKFAKKEELITAIEENSKAGDK